MILLLSLAGGLLGWVAHQVRPPLYEAKAVFTVNINYSQPDVLDKIDNDHYAEDLMIVNLMGLIQSADVVNKVVADVAAKNMVFDDLRLGKRLFVERKTSFIELIVRNEDPRVAMDVANQWAETANDQLKEAQVHALRTYTLNQEINNLAECIKLAPDGTGNLCMNLTLQELEAQLQRVQPELDAEVQASRGLEPALMFELSQRASLPNAPAIYNPQLMILAGVLLGFLISLIFLEGGAKANK
jgi:capsular polysaccharide biosynthesis protein